MVVDDAADHFYLSNTLTHPHTLTLTFPSPSNTVPTPSYTLHPLSSSYTLAHPSTPFLTLLYPHTPSSSFPHPLIPSLHPFPPFLTLAHHPSLTLTHPYSLLTLPHLSSPSTNSQAVHSHSIITPSPSLPSISSVTVRFSSTVAVCSSFVLPLYCRHFFFLSFFLYTYMHYFCCCR